MIEGLVSVVIPFYRGEKWLLEAVESVLAQTYASVEVIVVNDGSPEDIFTFMERYKSKVKYIQQENKGAAAARNVGIELSKGEYVAFLDADDVWMPEKLEIQISSMIKNDAYWSHTSYVTFGDEINEKTVDVSNYKGNIFPLCIISNPIATPSVVVKKSVFSDNASIRFDESMRYGEDTILWLRLSMQYDLIAINNNLVKVRIRGTNSALRAYSQIKARSDIWNTIKKKKIFDYKSKLSFVSRCAFTYCTISYKILSGLEKKNQQSFTEIFSKLLYVGPWIVFKIEKKSLINSENG